MFTIIIIIIITMMMMVMMITVTIIKILMTMIITKVNTNTNINSNISTAPISSVFRATTAEVSSNKYVHLCVLVFIEVLTYLMYTT